MFVIPQTNRFFKANFSKTEMITGATYLEETIILCLRSRTIYSITLITHPVMHTLYFKCQFLYVSY